MGEDARRRSGNGIGACKHDESIAELSTYRSHCASRGALISATTPPFIKKIKNRFTMLLYIFF